MKNHAPNCQYDIGQRDGYGHAEGNVDIGVWAWIAEQACGEKPYPEAHKLNGFQHSRQAYHNLPGVR